MRNEQEPVKDDPQSYAIISAAMEVHRRLGPGFLEQVYQEALAVEFLHRDIPFEREVILPIVYRDQTLSCTYRVDFICLRDNPGRIESPATVNQH